MCVWSLSGPLFHGGSGGGRTLCVLSFVLLDNRPLTPVTTHEKSLEARKFLMRLQFANETKHYR